MRKTISAYAAAAALSVGAFAFVGCDDRDDVAVTTPASPSGSGASVTVDADKPGTSDAQAAAARDVGPGREEIHDTFAEVVEASTQEGKFSQIVERFVDADRNRFGQAMPTGDALKTIDGRIADTRKAWEAKYGGEIDIKDEGKTFPASFMALTVGELGKNAGGVDVDVKGDDDTLKVDVDRKTGVDSPDSKSADTNLNDPGRDVATATIKGSHGMPDLQVPLIHEAGGWKIDVPDSLTAQKFHDLLLAHLTAVGEMKAQWPADQDEAYRVLTHHVFMAVMGKEVQK